MNDDAPALPFETAGAALSALSSGAIGAVELTEAALRRIAAVNPGVKALREIFAERALADARRCDAERAEGRTPGPLAGLPVVIKENIDTAPGHCSAGLDFRSGRVAPADAWATATLRAAGAIVLGTSISDPGGFGVRTAAVRHPMRAELTVGGSSGGSAAALAARLCYGALGTDTGGSIRIPASCCGIAGLKPTRGRLPLEGVFPLAWSLDHIGPMAASVDDLAPLARVLDAQAFAVEPGPRKGVVGYDPFYHADAQEQVQQQFQGFLESCSTAGFELRRVSLPRPVEVMPVHATIFCCEAGAFYLDELAEHAREFPPDAQATFVHLRKIRPQDYVLADRRRTAFRRSVESLFETVDFIVTPTLPVLAPEVQAEGFEIDGDFVDFTYALVRYTALFNHTGHPVLNMPCSGAGAACGIQVIGPLNEDAAVLAFGRELETAFRPTSA